MKIKHYSIALNTLTEDQIDTIWQWHEDNGDKLGDRDCFKGFDKYLDFDDEGLGFILSNRSDIITYEEWCELAGVNVNKNPMPEIKSGMFLDLGVGQEYCPVVDCGSPELCVIKPVGWEYVKTVESDIYKVYQGVTINGASSVAAFLGCKFKEPSDIKTIWQKQSPESIKLAELKAKRDALDKEIKELESKIN